MVDVISILLEKTLDAADLDADLAEDHVVSRRASDVGCEVEVTELGVQLVVVVLRLKSALQIVERQPDVAPLFILHGGWIIRQPLG